VENIAGTPLHTFQLPDRQGRMHTYLVHEHNALDGMALMYELLGLGAPALISIIGAAMQSEDLIGSVIATMRAGAGPRATETPERLEPGVEYEEAAPSEPEVSTADLSRMLGKTQLGAVGQDIAKALATGKAPLLTRKVLAHTLRDNRRLSDEGVFALAFKANYGEMLQALWRVCQINDFFPVPSMFSSSLEESSAASSNPPTSSAPPVA
jgi:hypothetical protein